MIHLFSRELLGNINCTVLDYKFTVCTYLRWYNLPLNSRICFFSLTPTLLYFTIYSVSLPFPISSLFLTPFLVCRPPLPLRQRSLSPRCQCVTDRCCILSASLCNSILLVIELSWSPRGPLIFTGASRSSLPPLPSTSSLAPLHL